MFSRANHLLLLVLGCLFFGNLAAAQLEKRAECIIPAKNNGQDDTPAILAAFSKCRNRGRIVFQNTTYNIQQVMRTTNLVETDIHIYGTLLWSKNTTYWLNNNQWTGFQNGSAAWFLGGTNVTVDGHGYGTLNGNGQVWYDLVKGQSNYPRRPHALAVWQANNFVFKNLRMVQSQMWTMTIMYSQNVLFDKLYISSTSSSKSPARNTDGADTIFSDNITFRNTYIKNGDDAIALKGNSTNILIEDCTFENSLGLAFGSVGQYPGAFERIENVTARRIYQKKSRYGAYVKTWTGQQVGVPPNGGGGGLGYTRNITLEDFTREDGINHNFDITQCTTFSGQAGDCDSSQFKVSGFTLRRWNGTAATEYAAYMDCSKAAGGCSGINITDFNVINTQNGAVASRYRCGDVSGVSGFTCN